MFVPASLSTFAAQTIAFLHLAQKRGHTLEQVHTYLEAAYDAEDSDVFYGMHAELRMVDFAEYLASERWGDS